MNLTQSDIRAAREGFKYVAVRGGKRVAYCSTQQEAKREAGSRGHVVSLSGLRYTSRNPSAAGVGHAVGKHTKYAARGAKRVAKSAWAGTKSFFGSAYKSFKAHNPARPTRKAIATDFRLWQEYVDPYGNTTREEFDGMSIQRKMAIMRSIWPSRPAHNPRRVDDGSGKY